MLGVPAQELIYLLPLAIPLLAIIPTVLVGARVSPRLRNLFLAGAAACSLISILYLWPQTDWSVTISSLSSQASASELATELRYAPGPWSLFFAVVLTVVALLAPLANLGQPIARGGIVLSLLALTCGLGACISASLFTTAVSWGLVDLALLGFNSWHTFGRTEMASVTWRAAVAYVSGFGVWGITLMQALPGTAALASAPL